jgi:hypothetical protein
MQCDGFLSFICMSCTYTVINSRYNVQGSSLVRTTIRHNMENFARASDQDGYAGGSLNRLVAPPMPDMLHCKARRILPLVLEFARLAWG